MSGVSANSCAEKTQAVLCECIETALGSNPIGLPLPCTVTAEREALDIRRGSRSVGPSYKRTGLRAKRRCR